MAAVEVTLVFELPGFTPSAGRAFVKDAVRIEAVREDAAFRLVRSDNWAYQNVRIGGAVVKLREGETERYTINGYGLTEYIVRDNEPSPSAISRDSLIIFGPTKNRILAEKVRDVLQADHDEFTGLDEPEEDRGGDSGDTYDLPF